MPPKYRAFKVIDEIVFSSSSDEKLGIYRAVQLVKPRQGSIEIRVCYYSKRKRNDGSEWWGLVPRPPVFSPEEGFEVAQAISDLSEKYFIIRGSIESE